MKYYSVLLLLIAFSAQAEVYRSVDKQGNVIFSDTSSDDAEKVELQESFIYTPPVIVDISEPEESLPVEIPIPKYKLTIISPIHDETIRENAGNISIASTLSPELNAQRGDKLVFSIDGSLKSEAQTETIYTFTNVDRGSHIAVVSVVDKAGKVIKSSKSVLFHLQRAVKAN